ncbi:unnamed protein product [Paramecium octaurelia]|uniref:Uncharacterized protein n=1 Tax=Paramecium octaurelia TaxID=43137 RepID=A0A8S1S8U4_PAROT|nr:unnamed protein product [Paramecium octaurelia]
MITPDCSKVITASSEGKRKVWDTSTHTEISQISDNFEYAFCIDGSYDGQCIAACGSNDQIIRFWNINNTQEPIFRLKYHTKTIERIKFVLWINFIQILKIQFWNYYNAIIFLIEINQLKPLSGYLT